jgi:hypothetical protein
VRIYESGSVSSLKLWGHLQQELPSSSIHRSTSGKSNTMAWHLVQTRFNTTEGQMSRLPTACAAGAR